MSQDTLGHPWYWKKKGGSLCIPSGHGKLTEMCSVPLPGSGAQQGAPRELRRPFQNPSSRHVLPRTGVCFLSGHPWAPQKDFLYSEQCSELWKVSSRVCYTPGILVLPACLDFLGSSYPWELFFPPFSSSSLVAYHSPLYKLVCTFSLLEKSLATFPFNSMVRQVELL